MTKIDYVLTGCANGHTVRIKGRGALGGNNRLQLTWTAAQRVLAFDATFAHLAGIDVVAALANGLVVGHEATVAARCRADVFTEGGAEVGSIAANVAAQERQGRYLCEVQLVDAWLAVEPGERLTAIGERTLRVGPVLGGVAVFSTVAITTSRGHEWTALSTTLVPGCDAGEIGMLTLAAIRPDHRQPGR